MIKLQVIGNLGKDCTVNSVNGKSVINFNIAHTEKYKTSNGEQQEKTVWVECAYWSDSKVSAYLTKGQQVYVEGSPEVRTYEINGKHGASLVLKVFNIQLLGSSKQEHNQQPPIRPTQQKNTVDDINIHANDLPF